MAKSWRIATHTLRSLKVAILGVSGFSLLSKRGFLTDVRYRMGNLDKVAAIELGKCYRPDEGLRGRLLGKNDVLMGEGGGLEDIRLVKTFRGSKLLENTDLRVKLRGKSRPYISPHVGNAD